MQNPLPESSLAYMDKFSKEGCLESFSNLYDRYAPALLGVIARVTGAGTTAENILQQSFLEIWRKKETYQASKESPFVWMNRIALKSAMRFVKQDGTNEFVENRSVKDLVYDHKISIS